MLLLGIVTILIIVTLLAVHDDTYTEIYIVTNDDRIGGYSIAKYVSGKNCYCDVSRGGTG